MEIGLRPALHTYAGGLGVLAGDTIRSAADRGLPLVAVTLVHRKGYFRQQLAGDGQQEEAPHDWPVEDILAELPQRVSVVLGGRTVRIRCWLYSCIGLNGHPVPVYLLDTDLPENAEEDRRLTDHLYGGDARYRLAQEYVLGVGGLRMLSALGFRRLMRYHLNEGHSSLLALELLRQRMHAEGRSRPAQETIEAVREQCVFTTHTPVPAGHDRFPLDLAREVLGEWLSPELEHMCTFEGMLNMTYAALNLSRYINGVARRHGEQSRLMFAGYDIDSITNGVHAATWTSEPIQDLLDRYVPGWRRDNGSLRYASGIPLDEIERAHARAKDQLLTVVNQQVLQQGDQPFRGEAFTIGCARRATGYKRLNLILQDLDRLERMAQVRGPLQIVFAGKSHPNDGGGKEMIRDIFARARRLHGPVRAVYLPGYDMQLGKRLTSGCDLWLNTPEPPLEASGTSGMKAALNGVPSLSTLDGWWIEGHIEGITGWAIGESRHGGHAAGGSQSDAESLYEKLEQTILPLYYEQRGRYLEIMRHTLALNGSFFNTERMIAEYMQKAYRVPHGNGQP
jgi:starch phosphorylase